MVRKRNINRDSMVLNSEEQTIKNNKQVKRESKIKREIERKKKNVEN
jgi:hypothetical protein